MAREERRDRAHTRIAGVGHDVRGVDRCPPASAAQSNKKDVDEPQKPHGHSNVYAEEAEGYPDLPEVANIPLIGGSRVDTCRPLPPLALRRHEWETIGRKMGWLTQQVEVTQ